MDLFRVDRYMGDDEVVESQHNENSRFNQLQRDIENRRRKRKSLQNESSAPLSLNNPDFVANNLQSKEDLVLVEKKKAKKKKKTSMVDMHDELEGESEKKVSKRSSKSDSKNKDGNGKVRKLSVETHVVRDDVELEDIVEKRKEKKKKKKDKVDHDSKEGKDCEEDTNVEEKQITEEISQGKKSKNTKFDSKEGNDIEEDTNVEEKQNTEQISQTEPTGFTVIGGQKKDKVVKKVQRVLPDWLAKPTVINTDLSKSLIPVEDMSCLDPLLVSTLQRHNIDHLFPVQSVVIPTVLSQMDTNTCFSKGGYQPSDICVSAPTGSGKTLAYVLPIVQSLLRRVVRHLRALILLPTKDLANQVKQVFEMFTEGTGLRVGLASGSKSFSKDQEQLISQSACGSSSRVDILVCTPGRLVDHISSTPHFSLQHVRFLVIDEADRLLDQSYHGWLRKVLKAAYNNHSSTTQLTMDGSPVSCTLHTIRSPPGAQTPASFSAIQLPLQKLLFSATMTHSPEKLAPLHLYQPVLFTAAAAVNQTGASELSTGTADVLSFGRYTIPEGLSEYMTVCNDGEKPLVVLYCLMQLKFQRVICFASSLEATHRLYLLVKLYGGVEAAEYSSSLTPQQRKGILRDFRLGKLQLLICSDAMARGMDIQDVLYVISYDVPNYVRSYVHRVGRTARAGNEGTAITLLHGDEVHHFKELIHKTGREKIAKYNIKQDNLQSMVEKYQDTLGRLQDTVQVEHQNKRGRKRGTQDVMKMLQEQITSNLLHKDK